jgi:anaerobic ribonucleoside-triphosphate reductase activating protein
VGETGLVSTEVLIDWLASLDAPLVGGVTITGGEPFDQAVGLHRLLASIRDHADLRDLDVLVYSGYPLSRLKRFHPSVLSLVDALISGPYVASRPTELPWRGSSNQRLTVLNIEATTKYAEAQRTGGQLQVSADGGQLWITGIPHGILLDELEASLQARGVRIEEVSWRS